MRIVLNAFKRVTEIKTRNQYIHIVSKRMCSTNSEIDIPEADRIESQKLFDELKELNINYKEVKHGKVNSIKEILDLNLEKSENVIKNLFLKDKKKNYFYLCVANWKKLDLKNVSTQLKTSNLRFVDDENLKNILNVNPGSLTPFSIKSDKDNIVKLYFDEDIKNMDEVIIHPMHNYSCIYVKTSDVIKYCDLHNHTPEFINLPDSKDTENQNIKRDDTSIYEENPKDAANLTHGKSSEKINEKDKGKDGGNILGITSKKEQNFSDWYTQVIVKSELIEYYDISGCYILRPASYYIWECIQTFFNNEIKKLDVENSYFPLFVTKNKLEKEKNHIEGFSPEVAWVTKYGDTNLPEEIAIRPTSETIMYSVFSKWIRSHRDLPLKLNQWNTVVRWEFKQPTPFIRTREFLWQEGHTAHKNEEEAVKMVFDILDIYRRWYEECLAVPVIKGIKSEGEKFGGANFTSTNETFISESGRAIQAATSHYLGTNFAKMFKIEFEDEQENKQYVHQTSWGCTTRSIGVMIMVHSDNKGLILPPNVAKYKAVIVPILYKNTDETAIFNYCKDIEKILKNAQINCIFDDRDLYSPGYKFNHWELRGIPIRIEVGPKDIQNNSCVFVRRDNNQKFNIKKESVLLETQQMLVDIHKNLFLKAKKKLDDSIVQITSFDQVMDALNKKKMVLAPWCEDIATEEEIKKETQRLSMNQTNVETSLSGAMKPLCIPLDQPPMPPNTKCFWSGKPAKRWCLFGRSY
ncbi:proline--tRNA ligase, putative [Plasmodium chabaudi chabaudi]|uniref:proline--tRNA ligase n=1 Tax=Plasmodium chabaudi chabaudi TaxID=31271 RepID=A0A4V0KCV4_PLACU|nr:proline--tRNA ligase, putative [Plasmodium chabaudi chabaudi]VTZ70993.1 proline--tRNA ligase, putative [Plasmodium chabaudi chabaudi]|eukprot:XP_733650.2 proline--tRNA ligase, putative [Plasmodium chabaudi chabaudi]